MMIYHDLEILNVNYVLLNAVSNIIENSKGNIKIFSQFFDLRFENNFDEDSLHFIHKIYENCPSIEYLSLAFPPSNDHFTEFEKLLKVCQKLLSIILIISNEVETIQTMFENGEELLKVLIRSAPSNLREIRFFKDFKFPLKALEEFLEKWKGRSALTILTTDSIYEGDDYIKLINKYGVIKDFKCGSTIDVHHIL